MAGRGGFGGGRGGRAGGSKLPFDDLGDLENDLDVKPSEMFPPIQPPIAEPPSADEKRVVHHYRTLRARIHDGPLYSVIGDNVRVSKSGRKSPLAAHFDPFEGQPTYTQRYKRKKNTLPNLSTRPFVKELFPKELWSTIDPSDKSHVKKTLTISTRTRLDKFLKSTDLYDPDDPDRPTADEDDEDINKDDDENENPDAEKGDGEEEADPDQFDEDDEDDNDDYNAENYFDGGDDDDYGDDGAGGEDDGY